MKIRSLLAVALLAVTFAASQAEAGGLRGSRSSMTLQHDVAVEDDLPFLDSEKELRKLVKEGGLEMLEGNADYKLNRVSFPYARPEVRLFIERISAQYRKANGEQLIVTSLTRPSSLQPRNAHQLSVHPAGMAVDFRLPTGADKRAWLESALLEMENAGLLDVTRERFPPHYHVAVFPAAYGAHAARLAAAELERQKASAAQAVARTVETDARLAISAQRAGPGPIRETTPARPVLALAFGLGALVIPGVVLIKRKARNG